MIEGIILHPRGIGYGGGYASLVTGEPDTSGPDMAMFARSRADAYTFADWVAGTKEERGREVRVDRCYIDYRPFEPGWLQVKVVVEKEHEAVLSRLYNAITIRDGWCDEATVKWALDPENNKQPIGMRYYDLVEASDLLPNGYHAKMPEGPRRFEPTDNEKTAILALCRETELSPGAVIRQSLRLYQMHQHRIATGETITYSGDAQRAAEFAGEAVAS